MSVRQLKLADVVQSAARSSHLTRDGGANPTRRLHYARIPLREANELLDEHHYLGPIDTCRFTFGATDAHEEIVACQVWRWPTARLVPTDWLELVRWCITPEAGQAGGSQFMGWARRWLHRHTDVPMLLSYSELERHNGALYRSSGWQPAPTHHAERFLANGRGYPSGNGSWDGVTRSTPKMRWVLPLDRP